MPTDTEALAAAIADFEREFPDLDWLISRTEGASARKGQNRMAVALIGTPAECLRKCGNQVRRAREIEADLAARAAERQRILAEHEALLTAEYGPPRRPSNDFDTVVYDLDLVGGQP